MVEPGEPLVADNPVDRAILLVLRTAVILLLVPPLIGGVMSLAPGLGSLGSGPFAVLLVSIAIAPGLTLTALALSIAQHMRWAVHPALAASVGALATLAIAAAIWPVLLTPLGIGLSAAAVVAMAVLIIKIGTTRTRFATLLLVGAMGIVLLLVLGGAFG